jgi:hypothetical protein
MIEKCFEHPTAITVWVFAMHREVFIEIERDNAREIEALIAVEPNEFAVQANGSRAGGQTENSRASGRVILADEALDHERDVAGGLGAGGENKGGNASMGDVVGRHR